MNDESVLNVSKHVVMMTYAYFMMIDYAFLLWMGINNSVRDYYVVVNACCLQSVWTLNIIVVVEFHLLV